jgi:hypothetical protein
MPLSTNYLLTVGANIDVHWGNVNTALGASPLLLRGGYARATFTADRTALQTAQNAVINLKQQQDQKQGALETAKKALRPRITQFRKIVTAQLKNTGYDNDIPDAPAIGSAEQKFLAPFEFVRTRWTDINAATIPGFTGPLKLAGGYLLATYALDLAALKTAYDNLRTANIALSQQIGARDALVAPFRTRLVEYREMVQGTFTPPNALLDSLPRITPPAGSTPQAVALNVVYNPATNSANFAWGKSDNTHFARYSVRYCAGPKWDDDLEIVLKNFDDINILTYNTNLDVPLPLPGSEVVGKVFVVTDTDNERGSKAVKIVRP